jgi:hypothetical protein
MSDIKVVSTDRYTVYRINPKTSEKINPLFTGRYSEAMEAMNHLVNVENWRLDHVGLMNDETGRWASFNLSERTV